MYDLIVIGAGPGGYEAAAHAARLGKRVALVEKGSTGGTCLNVGCIPTKTLLKSARVFQAAKRAACYGVNAGNVTFDMQAVLDRKRRVVATLTRGVDGMLKRAGVERIAGHARVASRGLVSIDGQPIQTRNILLATGSRPATPPIPGLVPGEVYDSTSILSMESIPASVVIIGGGYIGLEFASFFAMLGVEVTVIEMLDQVGGATDAEIAGRLARDLAKAQVVLRTGCRVTSVSQGSVTFQDGSGAVQSLRAACILNAAGRVPVLEDLGLAETGIDFSPRGIRTSDEGRTNVPGIWACGDVTGRRMLAHAATREGIVAVNNMLGRPDRLRYHAIPSVIYTHPEVASVGWTEGELKSRGVDYRRAVVPMTIAGRFLVENDGAPGMVKVLAGTRFGEILGVHMIGDGASELVAMAASMVAMELTAEDVAQLVFPHPTVSEALRSAVLELS